MIRAIHPETGVIFQVMQIGDITFTGKVIHDPKAVWRKNSICSKLSKKEHYIALDWDTYRIMKGKLNDLKRLFI